RCPTQKPRASRAFVGAGGGTRTPDTRIMMLPLRLRGFAADRRFLALGAILAPSCPASFAAFPGPSVAPALPLGSRVLRVALCMESSSSEQSDPAAAPVWCTRNPSAVLGPHARRPRGDVKHTDQIRQPEAEAVHAPALSVDDQLDPAPTGPVEAVVGK